ncbi:NAD(P)/FAD-dependent oxidoreductase [Psychrobacter sp. AOP7-D1-15]|uniref:NAD(P)/FAD-dependent oxidoreductase n=1 Tax=unclassified Psychrobacter TaxID=196806 RepID=UPI0018663205|nr:FAD-binding oxidoreductase [Psychrobacter sp. FME61]
MAPIIKPIINPATSLPHATTVVIIGGGIVGLTAALTLAERNVPVVVLEKGRIAGEQSSRNLGWIRKTNRLSDDVPLALASDKLWAEMSKRVGADVGYSQSGILFIGRTPAEIAGYESWHNSIQSLNLDSRMVTAKQIDQLVPNGCGKWAGGIYTASDGRAEPTLASSAIANAAIAKGAVIIENCAVRTLATKGGRVSGVITEQGEILCQEVLLAGGIWSRRFLGNLGVSLPTLPTICSVLKTKPMDIKFDPSVGAPDFSFRKHRDGGYIISQRGKLDAPLTIDHLLLGLKFLPALKVQHKFLKIGLGKYFWDDLRLARKWKADSVSPFEKVRAMNPLSNEVLTGNALDNLRASWSGFENAEIETQWAGVIDITPDSNPVIDRIEKIPGLTIATGFSGHGFGTSPAAGQLAADKVMQSDTPLIDPTPYRFSRF